MLLFTPVYGISKVLSNFCKSTHAAMTCLVQKDFDISSPSSRAESRMLKALTIMSTKTIEQHVVEKEGCIIY